MMSKDGDKLAYGLNSRNSSNGKKKKKKKVGGLAGFDGGSTGSSDDDDDDEPNTNDDNGLIAKRRTASSTNSGRDAVNRAIVAEQTALRHRVGAAAAAAAGDNGVDYDYDAEYDSFSTTATKTNADTGDINTATTKEKAKPRYITSLLQTAQRRNREHEVVHERKVIHEQEEDEKEEYEGKERIITNSYKRKLEEREHWAKEEAERTRQEELRDKQLKESCNKGGYMTNSLMLGIVGRNLLTMNYNKNNEQQRTTTIDRDLGVRREEEKEKVSFLTDKRNNSGSNSSYRPVTQLQTQTAASDIARAAINGPLVQQTKRGNTANSVTSTLEEETAATTTTTTMMHNNQKSRQEILEERAIKIYNARKRYFERREKEKRLGVR